MRRPAIVLLLGALACALGAVAARGLTLQAGFDELLPENQPSVTELRRVLSRTAGVSNIYVVLEGAPRQTLRDFADALVPRLAALGSPWVGSSEDGVHAARKFLLPRAGLFATTAQLRALELEVDARLRTAVAAAIGADLVEEEPPPLNEERLRTLLGGGAEGASALLARYPDGYFEARDGSAVLVIARAAIASGEIDRAREALRRVRGAVEQAQVGRFREVHVGYAGDLVTGLYEYSAVLDDLLGVGILGAALVLLAVLLFYARLRALLALGCVILCGCTATFGLTRLVIGHLNVATGFLFSIIAGNGINFGIIWLARFLEERREGRGLSAAVMTTQVATFGATATAALAAAAAYAALAVTAFRGFRDFALIGAAGMLLCWLATVLLLPPLVVALERLRPTANTPGHGGDGFWVRLRRAGARYEAVFVWIVEGAPAAVAVLGVAAAALGAVLAVRWVASGPVEYDMNRLQNEARASASLYRVSARAAEILGAAAEGSMVILADRLEQVGPLRAELEARRARAPEGSKPFEAVRSLQDFVAPEQEEKLPLLLSLREKLLRARRLHGIADADWARIEPLLPPKDLAPWGLADLPAGLARPFTERDGTRGRLLFIEPTAGQSDRDLRYLLRWADAFRETLLPDGSVVRGSGRAVIFADMLRQVVEDVPRALAVSLATTVVAVLLAFRLRGSAATVLATLFAGLACMGGLLALCDVRLNFLNFMALPITLGVGVDYGVNLLLRVELEKGDVKAALRRSGGAVILCSLTTTLGYLALLGSVNQAVRSLGQVAVLGELCCLCAALLLLPAVLLWARQRRAGAAAASGLGGVR